MNSPDATAISAQDSRNTGVHIDFDNSYAKLPARFFSRVDPTPVVSPHLIQVNVELASLLGLDPAALASESGVRMLAGNVVAQGSEPLAMAYAGHQFGHFVPQLGDGRANLLGEVVGRDGVRYDLQLKGSGRTPFSRGGDGRAAIGPVLREYVVSEAMTAMGVPSTRALAAVATGERVLRDSPLPGAVLTRVAASHLRIGSFQYFAAREDTDAIRILADYAIARHYPEAALAEHPYRALLEGVISRQARLVAQWMLLGFVHGVMNTDNTSISGETIDFGPCAFLEAYDPAKVFSSIDHAGRYAYGNQARAMLWNLARLAETLLPLMGDDEAAVEWAKGALGKFPTQFDAAHAAGLRCKLGLTTSNTQDDALGSELLARMAVNQADFTLTFRRLAEAAASPEGDASVRALFADPEAYSSWAVGWRRRLGQGPHPPQQCADAMRQVNPAYIPRNHQVEAIIQAAVERQDFRPFEELLRVVTKPYEERPGIERYAIPARPEERVVQTFCGT